MSDLQLAVLYPYLVFALVFGFLWAAGFISGPDDDDEGGDGGTLIPAYARNN